MYLIVATPLRACRSVARSMAIRVSNEGCGSLGGSFFPLSCVGVLITRDGNAYTIFLV